MKKFLVGLFLLGVTLNAQTLLTKGIYMTNGTAQSVLSGRYVIEQVELTAVTGFATSFKLYDSAATTVTNVTNSATVAGLRYATNYSYYVTNEFGVKTTNTISGTYVTTTVVTEEADVERARLLEVTVPAGATMTINPNWITTLGLQAQQNATNGYIFVTYRRNP